jgi:hypothetical protein
MQCLGVLLASPFKFGVACREGLTTLPYDGGKSNKKKAPKSKWTVPEVRLLTCCYELPFANLLQSGCQAQAGCGGKSSQELEGDIQESVRPNGCRVPRSLAKSEPEFGERSLDSRGELFLHLKWRTSEL